MRTQTTVGFGDLVPTTIAGKITTSILTHFGILALALPITVRGLRLRCGGGGGVDRSRHN